VRIMRVLPKPIVEGGERSPTTVRSEGSHGQDVHSRNVAYCKIISHPIRSSTTNMDLSLTAFIPSSASIVETILLATH
jgi:hypothetical protein